MRAARIQLDLARTIVAGLRERVDEHRHRINQKDFQRDLQRDFVSRRGAGWQAFYSIHSNLDDWLVRFDEVTRILTLEHCFSRFETHNRLMAPAEPAQFVDAFVEAGRLVKRMINRLAKIQFDLDFRKGSIGPKGASAKPSRNGPGRSR